MNAESDGSRIDRLLDAIDLLKADRRAEAQSLLRGLIHDDNEFEDAWLWMSVAVESLDQSALSLDNVLRINPHNTGAARALLKVREPELIQARERNRLRLYRDLTLTVMWLLALGVLAAAAITLSAR